MPNDPTKPPKPVPPAVPPEPAKPPKPAVPPKPPKPGVKKPDHGHRDPNNPGAMVYKTGKARSGVWVSRIWDMGY